MGVAPRALARLRRRRLLLGLERGGRERVLRPERQGRHVRRERVLVVFRVETTRLVVRGALVLRRRGARLGDDSRAGGRRRDGRLFALRRLRLLRLVLVVLVRLGVHERAGRAARTPRRNRVGTHVGNRGGVGVRFVRRRDRGRARVEPGAPRVLRGSVSAAALAPPIVVRVRRPGILWLGGRPVPAALVLRGGVPGVPITTPLDDAGARFARNGPYWEARGGGVVFLPGARGGAGAAVVPARRRARGAPRLTEQSIVHARVALALAFRLALLRLRSRANELHTMGFVQLVERGGVAARGSLRGFALEHRERRAARGGGRRGLRLGRLGRRVLTPRRPLREPRASREGAGAGGLAGDAARARARASRGCRSGRAVRARHADATPGSRVARGGGGDAVRGRRELGKIRLVNLHVARLQALEDSARAVVGWGTRQGGAEGNHRNETRRRNGRATRGAPGKQPAERAFRGWFV